MADTSEKLTVEEEKFFRDKSDFISALYLYIKKAQDNNEVRVHEVKKYELEIVKLQKKTEHVTKCIEDAKASMKVHGIEWDTISTLFKL